MGVIKGTRCNLPLPRFTQSDVYVSRFVPETTKSEPSPSFHLPLRGEENTSGPLPFISPTRSVFQSPKLFLPTSVAGYSGPSFFLPDYQKARY